MLIHDYSSKGHLEGVREELRKGTAVDARDERDNTPLALAASSAAASDDLMRLLIESGADVNAAVNQAKHFPIDLAACSGSVAKAKCLLDAGANINATGKAGYTALIRIMYVLCQSDLLMPMADFLIRKGAATDCESDYGESPLSVVSRQGRFDTVKLLLDAGADSAPLRWTPLMQAVAVGTCDEVAWCLCTTNPIGRDRFSRTPLHLAAIVGDTRKADLLHDRGAYLNEGDRRGTTPLMTSVASGNCEVAQWLIDQGADVEAVDDSGDTALISAARAGQTECVRLLLKAGAERNRRNQYNETAKSLARNEPVVRLLTRPGEDLSEISVEIKRRLIGLRDTLTLSSSIDASPSEFQAGRDRRFGRSNPEVMRIAFWHAMVRAGVCAYQPRKQFGALSDSSPPIWCFDRYGMSFTELPDGRFVQIGGEHEDYYDPDFCIYNEVVVHDRSGQFEILGYPEEVFPPTDFHSATFVDGSIYIIGRLGYQGTRAFGTTPVRRLDCQTWTIQTVETFGDNPGLIFEHSALFDGLQSVIVTHGKIALNVDGKEQHVENKKQFRLDLKELRWSGV